jgi:hypothetical protein
VIAAVFLQSPRVGCFPSPRWRIDWFFIGFWVVALVGPWGLLAALLTWAWR